MMTVRTVTAAPKFAALLLGALVFLAVSAATPARAGDAAAKLDAGIAEGAHKFVRVLADRALDALSKRDMTNLEREAAFRTLFVAHFDVPTIAKWALGRYWRIATKAEQDEYQAMFEDYIVTTYTNRFRDYTNEHLDVGEVDKIADEDSGLMVRSLIVRDQPKPIRVDWRIASQGGGYKIVDVIVEGVSMVQTQRSEFSSVILRGGGKVAGLITELKLKTRSLRAQMN